MKIPCFACLLLALPVAVARAEVIEKRVEYKEGSTRLVGFLYGDDSQKTKLPGVIVFSDWMGVGTFAKDRARELAALGYRAFVADVYGEGKQAKDQTEAGALATTFKSDRPLMRKRARAALDTLLTTAPVEPSKVAAIGFCFGGTVSLELARDGAPLAGVVSFHGGLDTPDPALAKNIKGKLLVLHGADDPLVPEQEVAAFEGEMRDAGVDWQLVKYSRSVHAFTNPQAGLDPKKGIAYNELTAKRAYQAMRDFFTEIFAPSRAL
jgi:dienelactone hydrolase